MNTDLYPPVQPDGRPAPGYVPPQMEPSRRHHVGLWITIVIVVLLLLAGGGIFYYLQVHSTPQKTMQAYCNGLTSNNVLMLYSTYSSEEQARISEQTMQHALQILDAATGGFKNCTVNSGSVRQNGSAATGTITLTTAHNRSYTDTLDLVQENGQWKVSHNAALP